MQTYCMQDVEDEYRDGHRFIYFPLIGAIIVFMINQIKQEYCQYKDSNSSWEYFTDIYNFNDNIYLLLNATTIIVHMCFE